VYRSGDVQEGAGAGSSRRQLWCKLPFMCHMPQHSCVAFVAVCCIVLQCVLVYGRVLHSQAGGICGAVCLSYVTFLIHVWHLRCKLSFMYHMPHSCVTCPIHMWRVSFIHVWRASFLCDMPHSCVTCLIRYDTPHSCVTCHVYSWDDLFICGTHMYYMKHPYLWHVHCLCCVLMHGMTFSFVSHTGLKRQRCDICTWFICAHTNMRACARIHTHTHTQHSIRARTHTHTHTHTQHVAHISESGSTYEWVLTNT